MMISDVVKISDVSHDICLEPDAVPAMFDRTVAVRLALPVVVQTRLQVGCDTDLPLPVYNYKGQESLREDGPDDIISERESIIKRSDVHLEICVVSDQLPVVVPKLAAVPLAISVVTQTRPRVGWSPDLPLPVDEGRESIHEDGLDVIMSGRLSKVVDPDVRRGIQMKPEILPVVLSTDDVEPKAVPVVALTRSGVERPLVVARPVDEILSGRESNVGMSDVSRDICMEPDLLPVVMSTDDVEPLAVPVVALMRQRVEGPLVVARPVNVAISISRAAVYPDMLSRRVMKSVDPDGLCLGPNALTAPERTTPS